MNLTTRPARLLAWVALLATTGTALLSCRGLFGGLGRNSYVPVAVVSPANGLWLDHPKHLDKGLECGDCHGKEGEPKAPTYAACADCHDEEDAEKPDEKKIKNAFFAADGSPKWTRALAKYSPEVKFAHAPHVKKTECKVCHGPMTGPERKHGLMFRMESCQACHAQKGGPNECSTCHREIDVGWLPDTHKHLWKERHGQMARSPADRAEFRCDVCHTQPQWCERCHREEPPRSHNNLWRHRTHGVMAAIDRTSCQVCHTTDYCQRCHLETAPRSHRGQWVHGLALHCAECHFPIRLEESCRVCHPSEPRHESAPDMPSWHNPAMNCRGCHTPTGAGGAPPLQHFDNGMQCTFCHD